MQKKLKLEFLAFVIFQKSLESNQMMRSEAFRCSELRSLGDAEMHTMPFDGAFCRRERCTSLHSAQLIGTSQTAEQLIQPVVTRA